MSTRLPWFRLFTEARNDSKLDALNDREFRIWFKLLCFAAEGEPRGQVDYLDPEYVAMELRVGVDELDSAISRMVRLRLVERSDTRVTFQAFEERQYDKPSARPEAVRERVRKSRTKANGESVTPLQRDVTPLQRDVTRRTEQIRKRTEGVRGEVDNSANPHTIAEIVAGIRTDLATKAPQS